MSGMNKGQKEKKPEIVYCRATKCEHNKGRGKCDIVHRLGGDDKISIGPNGFCDNYYPQKPR